VGNLVESTTACSILRFKMKSTEGFSCLIVMFILYAGPVGGPEGAENKAFHQVCSSEGLFIIS
jgi:hypothetical protein